MILDAAKIEKNMSYALWGMGGKGYWVLVAGYWLKRYRGVRAGKRV